MEQFAHTGLQAWKQVEICGLVKKWKNANFLINIAIYLDVLALVKHLAGEERVGACSCCVSTMDLRRLIINHSFIITHLHSAFFKNNTSFHLIICHHR